MVSMPQNSEEPMPLFSVLCGIYNTRIRCYWRHSGRCTWTKTEGSNKVRLSGW